MAHKTTYGHTQASPEDPIARKARGFSKQIALEDQAAEEARFRADLTRAVRANIPMWLLQSSFEIYLIIIQTCRESTLTCATVVYRYCLSK